MSKSLKVPHPRSFRKPKVRGEWVELKFMVRAAEAGLTVSKPYGDSARFDFIVGHREPLHRVQVRGTRIFTNTRSFVCRFTWGYPPRRYRKNDFDFLAVYVVPCDTWYIIPMSALRPARIYLAFYAHIPNSRGRFEKYRNAFHLLARRTEPGPRMRSSASADCSDSNP